MTNQEVKSSMSPEERARRRDRVGKTATEKVAKSEQLNFRLEEHSISEIQSMAFRKGMPVGTMIREWVLERLAQEKLGSPERAAAAAHVLQEIHAKLSDLFTPALSSNSIGVVSPMIDSIGLVPPVLEPSGFGHSMSLLIPGSDRALTLQGTHSAIGIFGAALAQHVSDLEHLKAWEHVLADELTCIRAEREELEHRASPDRMGS